ncbi:MAG TPA: SAM-dependent chlorinase/fluorinase, partial [Petrotogaceae bacterium]|nr:SAM-dependent chlorinase/fluorinase [Petrotogaceae bacterium]
MKKNVLKSITVFIFITLFSTVIFAAGTQGFSGNVAEIDKYGNVRLDVTEEAVKLSGVEVGDILEVKFNDKTLILPFVTAYGDVDRSSPLLRLNKGFVQMAINYGNFATFFSVALNNTVTVSVLEKGTYKAQIELRKLVKSEERKDYTSDQAFANFREISLG